MLFTCTHQKRDTYKKKKDNFGDAKVHGNTVLKVYRDIVLQSSVYNFSQKDRFSYVFFFLPQPEEQDLGQRVQVHLKSMLSLFVTDTGPTALSTVMLKPLFPPHRYGGFSLGARTSQLASHTDDIDDAIAQLRRRFRLERVRDTPPLQKKKLFDAERFTCVWFN